ncbi:hypothetical protein ACWDSD_30090 [Streptomyces spiralis]
MGGADQVEVAQLDQRLELGCGTDGLRQAETAAQGVLEEAHRAAVGTLGEVRGEQGALLLESDSFRDWAAVPTLVVPSANVARYSQCGCAMYAASAAEA